VDGTLDFIGGVAEWQSGRVSHRARPVKLCRERVKVWCEGRSRGRRVGDEESDRASLVNLFSDCEGEGVVPISQDTSSDVWQVGCDQGGLFMFRGGGPGSIETSFCRRERLRGQDIGHRVADGRDFCGSEGALLLITLLGSNSRDGVSIGLGGLGAVVIKMTGDERGGVRVFGITECAGFP